MEATDEPEQLQILCSGCLRVVPESVVHVIPYFNRDAQGYVTTYRCDQCWLPALDETRAQLATTEDEALIASGVAFFRRHGIYLHEALRGDPLPAVRALLVGMIDRLRSATIRLPVSTVLPAQEAKAAVLEMKKNEIKRNERSFLGKAIDLAKRLRTRWRS